MRLVIFCTFALSFLSRPYRVSAQSDLSSLNNKKGETPCTLAMTLKYRCPNRGDSRPYDANYTNDPREQLTQIYPTDCTCNLVFYNLWSGCWLLTGRNTPPTFKTWGNENCQNASVPVSRLPPYDLSDAPDWVFRNVTSNSTFDEIGAIKLSSHPVQSTVKIVFIAFAVVLSSGLSAVFCYILWRRRRSSKEKWWDEVPSLRTPRKFFGLVSDVQRVRPISLRHTWSIEDDDNGKLNYIPSSADTDGGSRFAQFTSRVFRLSPFFDALLKRLPSSRRKRDQTIWRIDPLWLYETSGTHSQHQNLLGHPSPDDASAKKYKDTVPEINIVLVADADRGTEIEHTPPPQRQHASRPSESWRDTFSRLSQPRPGIAEAVATDANCSIEQPSSPSPPNLPQDVEVPYNIGGETRSNPRTPHRDAPKPSRWRSILKSKMWEPHSPPAGVDPRAHSETSRPIGQPSSERPPSIVPVAQLSPPARGDATVKLSPLPPPSTTFINTSVPSLPLYPSRTPAPRLPAPRGHDRFLSREMNSR